MQRRAFAALALGALTAACAGEGQMGGTSGGPPIGALPPVPASLQGGGMGDPGTNAINLTAAVFQRPASIAGNGAAAANAVAQLEYIAVDLATNQRWTQMPPLAVTQMREARDAVRQAVGIAPDATPTAVVQAMDAAAAAFRSGNRAGAVAALNGVTGGNGARAADVLSALPNIPIASTATANAQNGMMQMQNQMFRSR
jgi:hypothetical protein